MTDPITAKVRGAQAKKELRETEQAFAELRQALVDKLLATGAENKSTRETCYFAVQTLDGVNKALLLVVEGGRIEEALEEIAPKPNERFALPIRGTF